MEIFATILLVVGGIANIVGSIWILINAFKESIWWGLGSLILSFPVMLIYAFMHWPLNKKPFLISIAGVVLMIVGIVMAGGSAMTMPAG